MKPIHIILSLLLLATIPFAYSDWWYRQKADANSVQTREFFGPDISTVEDGLTQARGVTSLTISTFDTKTQEVVDFSVAKTDRGWVIPSHSNYPADGGSRTGQIAGNFLALKPIDTVNIEPARFAEVGLLDPNAPDVLKASDDSEAYAKRVTLKNAQDRVLLDVLVGKQVDEKWGQRYVRVAGEDKVYTAKIDVYDLETDFEKWVERDLLKIKADEIRQIVMDPHRVEFKSTQEAGVIPGEQSSISRTDKDAEWVDGAVPGRKPIPAGKILDQDKLKTLVSSLTDIRLSGVRPLEKSIPALRPFGIYVDQQGNLFAREGGEQIITADGMVFHLSLGELAEGSGKALSSGAKAGKTVTADAAKKDHRYLAIFAQYEEKLDSVLQAIKDDPPAKADEKKDDKAPKAPTAEEKKKQRIEEMKAKAKTYAERFDRFIFVVSDDTVKKIRPIRDSILKDKPLPAPVTASGPLIRETPIKMPDGQLPVPTPEAPKAPEAPILTPEPAPKKD